MLSKIFHARNEGSEWETTDEYLEENDENNDLERKSKDYLV